MIVSPITKFVFLAYFIALILISLWSYFRRKASNFRKNTLAASLSQCMGCAFTWATSGQAGGTLLEHRPYYTYGGVLLAGRGGCTGYVHADDRAKNCCICSRT